MSEKTTEDIPNSFSSQLCKVGNMDGQTSCSFIRLGQVTHSFNMVFVTPLKCDSQYRRTNDNIKT